MGYLNRRNQTRKKNPTSTGLHKWNFQIAQVTKKKLEWIIIFFFKWEEIETLWQHDEEDLLYMRVYTFYMRYVLRARAHFKSFFHLFL